MDGGEYCILREETVRERRGSYNGFCCRLYPFICWIIIKEGPGNFSGGRSPHWVNHVNLCLSCIVCLCVLFLHLFYFIAPRSCFSNRIEPEPYTTLWKTEEDLCYKSNQTEKIEKVPVNLYISMC
jgi:hypothetical protein